ncbi:hypothetical protein TRAPUB_12639 [Trametes pubescens]|uniref:Uncharacterized protein n=1 Tax=Trametes pubescens TaxID=154538 RepID=A0A1M2VTC7_TRAPU|nr:hypothetical protein TRAPUB_12639 [Trametes pubescens]
MTKYIVGTEIATAHRSGDADVGPRSLQPGSWSHGAGSFRRRTGWDRRNGKMWQSERRREPK